MTPKPKGKKKEREVEIIESPRQFETVGEVVRFEILQEVIEKIEVNIGCGKYLSERGIGYKEAVNDFKKLITISTKKRKL